MSTQPPFPHPRDDAEADADQAWKDAQPPKRTPAQLADDLEHIQMPIGTLSDDKATILQAAAILRRITPESIAQALWVGDYGSDGVDIGSIEWAACLDRAQDVIAYLTQSEQEK